MANTECGKCGGTGAINFGSICRECDGSGQAAAIETVVPEQAEPETVTE